MKSIGIALIFIFLFIGSINFSRVFASWKSYAILTEDFGILKERDYILRESESKPGPITGNYSSFTVWQCFSIDNIDYRITCGDSNDPNLVVITSGHWHKYYFNRTFEDQQDCLDVINRWKKLISSEDSFCVKGYFSGYEKISPHNKQEKSSWTIDRIKSLYGCWSYSEDEWCPSDKKL